MNKDEALKLALEALKYPLNQSHENFNVDMAELLAHRAITAIKEALAQPEPWEKFCDSHCVWTNHHPDCKLAQRTWVGLTDDEFWELDKEDLSLRQFVQAIDDRLQEKNT